MTTAATGPTSTRKDAARNRERLLEAAADLFRRQGLETSLKDVARKAGVGVGTVYRHFPTKEDLVAALFEQQLDDEVARAEIASRGEDAWTALFDYLKETMRIQAADRGLRALLCPQGSPFEPVQECHSRMDPHVERLVERAHEQGMLREDVTARDLRILQVALVGVMDATPSEPDAWRRHLEIFLDGVRVAD